MRHILLAIALVGCRSERVTSNGPVAQRPSLTSSVESRAPVHSVTGYGHQKVRPGVEFATTLAVHQDASGRVWGSVVTHLIDLSAFGETATGELIQEPVCMRVVGDDAYISMVTVRATPATLGKPGDKGVFWVRDGGKAAGDVAYGGPAFFWDPSDAICTSTPPRLPAVPMVDGGFTVR